MQGRTEGDTRSAILAAARHVFAERGLSGASMREVAEAARINNAMIYYHFKDKDHLYRSVLNDSFAAMNEIWNDPLFASEAPVQRQIEKYVECFIRFQQNNEELHRIMAMDFAGSGGKITWICENYFTDNFTRLADLFRKGMKNGELVRCDSSIAVSSIIGMIVHNFIMQPMAEHVYGKRVDLSPKKFGAFVTGLFFNGLSSPKSADRRKPRTKRIAAS